MIKQDISTGRLATSEAETVAKIENGWRQLDTRVLQTLIRSMPARCAAVIAAGGGPTKY